MALLSLKDIGKIYVSEGSVAVGIRGVNLSFDRGEFVAILGLILAYTVLDYFSIAAFGIFMAYSLGKFYYDLDMLLVHKSYLLMASGIVFLSLFYFIKKLAK